MIDATLHRSFFKRKPDGTLVHPGEAGFVSELGALDALPEEEDWSSDDEEGYDDNAADEDVVGVALREDRDGADRIKSEGAASKSSPRKRIDYRFFEQNIWPSFANSKKHPVKSISASNVYQEIQSFIKVLATVHMRVRMPLCLHLCQNVHPSAQCTFTCGSMFHPTTRLQDVNPVLPWS
jgi:hypothetical protein